MRFSIICPSNDPEKLNAMLKASLKVQSFTDYELIVVDTKHKHFDSAAEALNDGAKSASGEYLVFSHHDITFESPSFLQQLSDMLKGCVFKVAGVAGCDISTSRWRKSMYTNIVHGDPPIRPCRSIPINGVRGCQTLDECFFIIPTVEYIKRPFPVFSTGWHLYAVEYSLWANTQEADSVIVLPIRLWHHSAGASFDESYYKTLYALIRIYVTKYRFLYTPLGAWPTSLLLCKLRVIFSRIRRFLRGEAK